MSSDLLRVENLHVSYPDYKGSHQKKRIEAVRGVSFTLNARERLGIVGESGCGKSTLGRAVLTLGPKYQGSIRLHGEELSALHGEALRHARRKMGMVFQDTLGAFNPRKTVWEMVCSSLRYQSVERGKRKEIAAAALQAVGLEEDLWNRMPHTLSGGQRQRAAIARAIAGRPELVVCDEAVSALDGEIRKLILSLLDRISMEYEMALLFISHDLRAVRQLCEKVAVMYMGCFVEVGATEQVFSQPMHPYTQALLHAEPVPDPDAPHPTVLGGEPPDLEWSMDGCPFFSRCPWASAPCRECTPGWREGEKDHFALCCLGGAMESRQKEK